MSSNRYKEIEPKKNENNDRVYKTMLLPNIQREINDIYIIGKANDRLDLLASKYYGDSSLWWVIAEANKLGKGSLFVPIGGQIRIPFNSGKIEALVRETQEKR